MFGLMFQIKDDLLNILPDQSMLGKQKIGSDILNGKRTLMVVHSFSHTNNTQKKKMKAILGNSKATQKDVMCVIDFFQNSEGLNNF